MRAIMERPDDVDKPRWTAKLEEHGSQAVTTACIKRRGQVHQKDVQVAILLAALFFDLSYGEEHVNCLLVSPEATLTLGNIIQ